MTAVPHALLETLEALGPLAALAYVPLYVLGSFLLIPGPVLGIAAGVLFGMPLGFIAISLSSLVSAATAFLAGRYWSGAWANRKMESDPRIHALERAICGRGWRMLALLRLTAVLPFSFMNYMLGLSRVRLVDYLTATWVGMIPGALLYAWIGATAGEIALQKGGREKAPAEWVLFAITIFVTTAISSYATHAARKAMRDSDKREEPAKIKVHSTEGP